MKQTAVEFLASVLSQAGLITKDDFDSLVKQARAMEKEQIINAWNNAYDKGTRDRLEKVVDPVGDADTYFKETFKQQEQ
jgi:hypothetical protein